MNSYLNCRIKLSKDTGQRKSNRGVGASLQRRGYFFQLFFYNSLDLDNLHPGSPVRDQGILGNAVIGDDQVQFGQGADDKRRSRA